MDTNLIFAGELPPQTISNRVRRGQLRRLARGIYTTDTATPAESIVARAWHLIVGHEFPGAVITDRSALTGGRIGGYVYLAHDAPARELVLPGLRVAARRGRGPIDGDFALPGGLSQASRPRALVENLQPTRARGERPRRTLSSDELDGWIDRLCRVDGHEALREYRRTAQRLAPMLGVPAYRFQTLADKIAAAIGTHSVPTLNAALRARQAGLPFDPDRVALFDQLVLALRTAAPQNRTALMAGTAAYEVQAFYEAYFSSYIEGTTFTLGEAHDIVYSGIEPAGRGADSHDILGTYRIVADHEEISRQAHSAEEFSSLLRSRHTVLMGGRPAIAGKYKTVPNQAGQTLFVDPALVEGTLQEGWRRRAELDTAWERALYVMFLVAEVHPFVDGNGRIARVMMNAELVAGGQSKIVVPTGFRSEYLSALRRLSRDNDPSIFVKSMRFLHEYTSQIDWASHDSAIADLRATHAFEEDDDGPRLRLLRTSSLPA